MDPNSGLAPIDAVVLAAGFETRLAEGQGLSMRVCSSEMDNHLSLMTQQLELGDGSRIRLMVARIVGTGCCADTDCISRKGRAESGYCGLHVERRSFEDHGQVGLGSLGISPSVRLDVDYGTILRSI